jgi:hypothetical protein
MKSYRLPIVVIIFVVVVLVCLIFSAKWFCQGYEHQFYSGFLGSILATIFAAFLVWVAWEELSKLSKTSSADFIHRLDNDFFTSKTRTLVSLIVCKALQFCPNDGGEPYFQVDLNKLDKTNLPEKLKQSLSRRRYYSALEIDDSLLGLFENVGILERRGIVDFQMVYDVFSWYLETAWNDDHIKEYIRYERRGDETAPIDTLIYYHFQRIAIKCLEYEDRHSEYEDLHSWHSRLWWKFKHRSREPKIERFPSITTPCDT